MKKGKIFARNNEYNVVNNELFWILDCENEI